MPLLDLVEAEKEGEIVADDWLMERLVILEDLVQLFPTVESFRSAHNDLLRFKKWMTHLK